LDDGDICYAVRHAPADATASADDVLEAAANALANEGKVISRTGIKLGAHKGVEIVLQIDQNTTMIDRLYVAKDCLYQTYVCWDKAKANKVQAAKFLDSFKLLEPTPGNADTKK
jgi:hypothetical protein